MVRRFIGSAAPGKQGPPGYLNAEVRIANVANRTCRDWRFVDVLHTSQHVDDRFGCQPGDGSAAEVLQFDDIGAHKIEDSLSLAGELVRPPWIVVDDCDRVTQEAGIGLSQI